MAAMPHLVQMHEKYAGKGLVIITVSLDPLDDKQMVKDANAFLNRTHVPFRNLLLNEPEAFWSKKFDFIFPPCYYVFDRRGQWVRFRAQDKSVNYGEMDKVIVQMLDDK
jgi:hypothetical protein